jgi:Aldolase/RraA
MLLRTAPGGTVTSVTEPALLDLAEIHRLAAEVDTTALCDVADDVRVVSSALRCRSANPVLCGPAVTVRCRDDFLGVVQAIEQAGPGDVVGAKTHPSLWPGPSSPNLINLRESFEGVQKLHLET